MAKKNDAAIGGSDKITSSAMVKGSQDMSKNEGFSNVSKTWYDKIKNNTFPWAIGLVTKNKQDTLDMDATLYNEIEPSINNEGNFVFKYNDKEYVPNPRALRTFCTRFGSQSQNKVTMSQAVFSDLLGMTEDPDDSDKYSFNHREAHADLFMKYIALKVDDMDRAGFPLDKWHWRLNNGTNEVRFTGSSQDRTGKDGKKKRGGAWQAIDNDWLLETLQQVVPTGLFSHWRGNADTIRSNILVPDCCMSNNGEDYGGGIAIRNSEVGELTVSVLPFTFRAICMNGCIHDRKNGFAIRQVHRGKIDLVEFREQIIKSVTKQLELVHVGIDALLNTRSIAWDGVSEKPIFSQLGKEFKLTPKQVRTIYDAYLVEVNECEENKNTLFGLVNATTRAAQGWDLGENDRWQGFRGNTYDDLLYRGEDLVGWSQKKMDAFVASAATLDAKDVGKYFVMEEMN